MEWAYGKPTQPVDHQGEVTLRVVYEEKE